ncbi:ABC transporter substrate-binding protein [Streptomyces sp. NRRL B-24484]|uniref:ABC transporter substrate-binding protein n=1 Tax=Streptomyces sp. NRRL B-24484 TaxID=1463833 RepID=UPI0004C0A8AE|nr:extracellular solute-binding protein [Streptomyces sp. NRRL B-24484]
MRRRWTAVWAATAAVLTACGGQGAVGPTSPIAPSDPAAVSGEITVLTNRTDRIKDGTFKRYADAFRKEYPGVTVRFEGLTDYEGEATLRMKAGTYGDVLLIPNSLSVGQFPAYFAPLGSATDLAQSFDFTEYADVGGRVYGVAGIGMATGLVYNKAVWEQAGITEWPRSAADFLADLKAIKDRTGAVPYYTNYKDGWPLRQWTDLIGAPSCSNTAKDQLADTARPWSAGQDLNAIDGLLYDVVHQKLSEGDPTATDWETSKALMGGGRIGAMLLGSWAVPQMQAAAGAAGHDPAEIGFMPFPVQKNSHHCAVVEPDYKFAVNKHSRHQDAARAWIDWFLTRSGSAQDEQVISTVKGTPLPAALEPFDERGVRIVAQTQDRTADVSRIDRAAGIGLDTPDYRRRLIDIARGAVPGDRDGCFAELNAKWAAAQRVPAG